MRKRNRGILFFLGLGFIWGAPSTIGVGTLTTNTKVHETEEGVEICAYDTSLGGILGERSVYCERFTEVDGKLEREKWFRWRVYDSSLFSDIGPDFLEDSFTEISCYPSVTYGYICEYLDENCSYGVLKGINYPFICEDRSNPQEFQDCLNFLKQVSEYKKEFNVDVRIDAALEELINK